MEPAGITRSSAVDAWSTEWRGHDDAVKVGEVRVSTRGALPSARNITHDDSALRTPRLLRHVEEIHVRHGDTLRQRT